MSDRRTVRGREGAAVALLLSIVATLADASPLSSAPTATPSRSVRRELDRDEALLRRQLIAVPEGSGVEIAREPQRVILRIPASLLFAPDRVDLKSDAMQSAPLSAAVVLLKRRRTLDARISVYSDAIGGSVSNQMMTQARARQVQALLTGAGILATRLEEHAAGDSGPLAGSDTPEQRSLNRRVEIEFAPEGAIRQAPATAP